MPISSPHNDISDELSLKHILEFVQTAERYQHTCMFYTPIPKLPIGNDLSASVVLLVPRQ